MAAVLSRPQCVQMGDRLAFENNANYSYQIYNLCFYRLLQGDSGGPAVCRQNGRWLLVGVTSGGSPICNVNRPSVYTRVSEFRDWISEQMDV